jgi:hypothetical protein
MAGLDREKAREKCQRINFENFAQISKGPLLYTKMMFKI